ncbi:hypothetical protein LAZ67_1000972 [Cordylochernes scorpioides]|uniref:Reverse transcriptase domain-containing protein n=1 Tax=Cordylochernes scorpioides TaxID=51811 RepID=A0ABY6JXK1_9ARAC|nr:hypothetical protein LAZ67_1000972 [Cordylochernes scorpioides]
MDPDLDAEISLMEVTTEISNLGKDKATGLDNIPNEAIKVLPDEYLILLTNIYNKILTTSSVPSVWTRTIIHPIFKNGDPNIPSNYREISLISNLSKLFTSIFKTRLNNYNFYHYLTDTDDAEPQKEEVICLLHDIVLLGESKINLQKKINVLRKYFEDNFLTLNQSKSKVMVFRNEGRKARSDVWFWGQLPLTITSKYTYLGYQLTASNSTQQAAKHFKNKALNAINAVWAISTETRINSIRSSLKLLDSMALSTLLYAAPIWANNQKTLVDRVQDNFLRSLLNLPRYTPGFILRMECGRTSLGVTVLKLTLGFWLRILKMNSSRLPHICLAQLYEISRNRNIYIGLAESLANILNSTGFSWLINCNDARIIRQEIPLITKIAIEQSIQSDHAKIENSKFYPHYKDTTIDSQCWRTVVENSRRTTLRWRLGKLTNDNAFKEGREEVADEPRSGRPTTARTDENVDRVLEVLRTDRRLSIQQIADTLHMSTFVVHGIVTEDLQMRKVCAKFVPKVLPQDQKELRVLRCKELLDLIQNEPGFLNSVVTGDESWMFEYDPESKRQSCAWHTKSSPRPKKARMSKSRIKTMITGQTVNSAFYLEVLRRLKRRIARLRTDIKDTVKLYHDNATSHTAFIITNFLARSNTPVIPHPPYSLDLAPCDFFLFPRLKREMKGKHWETVENIQHHVTTFLRSIPVEEFQGAFQALQTRLRKCIDAGGMYFGEN